MQIEIGERNLIDMTQDELYGLLLVDGLFNLVIPKGKMGNDADVRYFNDPVITAFNPNGKDTIFIDYYIEKISDGSNLEFSAHVCFDLFMIFYSHLNRNTSNSHNFKFKAYNYLIEKGFKLPLSTFQK